MSLKEPIVEGAHDKAVGEVVDCLVLALNAGVPKERLARLACSVLEVHLVPTDPAEVVAELRERSSEENRLSAFGYGDGPSYHTGRDNAFDAAADLVAEKLGVES